MKIVTLDHIQKSLLLLLCVGLVSCESENEKANAMFVEASKHLVKSREAREDSYSEAHKHISTALKIIDKIPSQYPSSDIAVQITQGIARLNNQTIASMRETKKELKQMAKLVRSPRLAGLYILEQGLNAYKKESQKLSQRRKETSNSDFVRVFAMLGEPERARLTGNKMHVSRTEIEELVSSGMSERAMSLAAAGKVNEAAGIAKDYPKTSCWTLLRIAQATPVPKKIEFLKSACKKVHGTNTKKCLSDVTWELVKQKKNELVKECSENIRKGSGRATTERAVALAASVHNCRAAIRAAGKLKSERDKRSQFFAQLMDTDDNITGSLSEGCAYAGASEIAIDLAKKTKGAPQAYAYIALASNSTTQEDATNFLKMALKSSRSEKSQTQKPSALGRVALEYSRMKKNSKANEVFREMQKETAKHSDYFLQCDLLIEGARIALKLGHRKIGEDVIVKVLRKMKKAQANEKNMHRRASYYAWVLAKSHNLLLSSNARLNDDAEEVAFSMIEEFTSSEDD